MTALPNPTVLFAEPDPSFFMMAAILSPTYSETMGPNTGGAPYWPRIALDGEETNESFRARLHDDYARGLDPVVRVAADRDELVELARDADILVAERTPVDAALLDAAGPRLRFVQKFGYWTRNVDGEAAAERGVLVAPWRRSANRRVAEHAVMLMLASLRRIREAAAGIVAYDSGTDDRLGRPGYKNNWVGLTGHVPLAGQKVGLIGLGEVGSEVAELLLGFDVEVVYTQRSRNEPTEARLGVRHESLDELLSTCDVVSVHLPLNAETEGHLSSRELGLLKPTAHLVNVSRGGLVDEAALLDALRSGAIAGAAFDTFWSEPLDPSHPIVGMANVVLTPHVASGAVNEDLIRSECSGPLINVARVLEGRLPYGVNNPPAWPRLGPTGVAATA